MKTIQSSPSKKKQVLFCLFCFECLTFKLFILTLPPTVELWSNHLNDHDLQKVVGRVKQVPLQQWKETCCPTDLTYLHWTSQLFPLPPHLLSHSPQQFHMNYLLLPGRATLLMAAMPPACWPMASPSMLLICLRLARSGRTPLLHQTLLRDSKK